MNLTNRLLTAGALLAVLSILVPSATAQIPAGPSYKDFATANGWIDINDQYIEDRGPQDDPDADGLDNETEWRGWETTITDAAGVPTTGWFTWNSTMVSILGNGPSLTRLDTDSDGIADYWEAELLSNPNAKDTDGDTLPDPWEAGFGLNYLSAAQLDPMAVAPPIAEADADPDGDGLTSGEEYNSASPPFAGTPRFVAATIWELTSSTTNCGFPYATLLDWIKAGGTSPVNYDTDYDELIDSFEFAFGIQNAINPGVADAAGDDPDLDGLISFREQRVHPLIAYIASGTAIPNTAKFAIPQSGSDTIGWVCGAQGLVVPGYLFAAQFDTLLNNEFAPGDVVWGAPGDYFTDPRDFDTDNDALPDGWELEHGLNPLSAGIGGVENMDLAVSGALGDPDADDLFNLQEYFGQDGYRIDYRTGTGDESNPWIGRLFNAPALSDFAEMIGQGTIGAAGHQAPAAYDPEGLGFIASYGSGPYWGFFDPTSLAAGTYVPIIGVPPFVVVNDQEYLGLPEGSFQPFATAITGLSWYDQDGDGYYTPGLDPVWLAVTDPAAYTPGDPILDDFYLLQDGVAPGGTLAATGPLANIAWFDDDGDTFYTPGMDSVWQAVAAPGVYTPDDPLTPVDEGDPILFDGGALAATISPATLPGTTFANAYYFDNDLDAAYTPGMDPVWLDDVTVDGGAFTQEDPLVPVAADTILDDVGVLESSAGLVKSGALTDAISTIWPMPGTDTDDDGWQDALEIQMDPQHGKSATSPVQSHNPFAPRSALLLSDDGISPNLFATADSRRFFSRDFTVESWVYLEPEAGNNDFQGSFIRGDVIVGIRTNQAFDLGVKKVGDFESVPYVAMQNLSGAKTYVCAAARSIPYGQWVHLAGVFDHKRNALTLYINGLLEQSLQVLEEGVGTQGATYGGTLVLGQSTGGSGFADRVRLDEVRIWGAPRSADEIADNRLHLIDWVQNTPADLYASIVPNTLLAYFTFDDGGLVAEDLVRRAKCSLLGYDYPHDEGVANFPDQEYLYPDLGFGIPILAFSFDANNPASVIGALDGERGEFDSDRDGLPDSWEIVHEFNPFKYSTPDHNQISQYDPAWGAREPVLINRIDLVNFRASTDFGTTWSNTTATKVQTVVDGLVTYVADPNHVIIGDYDVEILESNQYHVVTAVVTNFEITVNDVAAFLMEGETWYVARDGTPISQLAEGEAATNEIVSDAARDMELPSGDGLDNQYEYWAHTNPRRSDTDADGIADSEEDFDGDGLANRIESTLGSRPDLRDTDDDGVMDSVERSENTSTVGSDSPAKEIALYLDGNPGSYLEANDRHEFRLANWTVEAQVLPTDLDSLADGQGASIVRRVVQDTTNDLLAANFDLRVVRVGDYLTPEIRYVFVNNAGQGQIVSVQGSPTNLPGHRLAMAAAVNDPYPTDGLSHLAGTYNEDTAELRLYLNGSLVAKKKFPDLSRPPQSGKGARSFVRFGEGFKGFIDDVRIWTGTRTEEEIYNGIDGVDATEAGLLARYALDDGGWPAITAKGRVIAAQADPPAAEPTQGDRYLIAPLGATGVWTGHENAVAEYTGAYWNYSAPEAGVRLLVADTGTVLEWTGAAWTLPSDPNVIRGVDYVVPPALTAAERMDGVSWLDGTDIVTIDSGLQKTSPAPAQVAYYDTGTLSLQIAGVGPAEGDFAWWCSKAEYYQYINGVWYRWGPALKWLAPVRLKVAGIFDTEADLFAAMAGTTAVIGERYIVWDDPVWGGDAVIYTATAEDGTTWESYSFELLNVDDRVLDRNQAVLIWDGLQFVELADASAWGGQLYVLVRSEGMAYKSDGTVWDRWGMIPSSEDATSSKDWNNQWRNAARISGYGSFRLLDGVSVSTKDTDGDGLPDDWEIANDLDPNVADGIDGADGDPDGDGLSNLNEYWLGYDPQDADTNSNGINDGEEDFDGDGLPNWYEQDITKTRPDMVDTDDDGLTDYEEAIGKGSAERISSPINSLDPPIRRSMEFKGNGRLTVEAQARHHLQSWTLMAWVKPAEDLTGDSLVVRRTVPASSLLYTGGDLVNYELGLAETSAGLFKPYVRHVGLDSTGNGLETNGVTVTEAVDSINDGSSTNETLGGHQATGLIVAGEWAHLAGSYDAETHTMSLYINGELSVYRNDVFPPSGMGLGTEKLVMGSLTIGGGRKSGPLVEKPFKGWMDDVKVLRGAASADMVADEAAGEISETLQTINQTVDPEVRQLPIAEALQYEHTNKFVLVRFKAGTPATTVADSVATAGLSVNRTYEIAPIYRLELPDGADLAAKLATLRADANVLYAEPDYVVRASRKPNDPLFGMQWGMHNDGSLGGTLDADIDAPEAWTLSTGDEDVIVAVIDTGVDYTHPDLVDNMWVNEDEIPGNNVDDDKNGYVDDYHGYNFSWVDSILDGDAFDPTDPMDRNGHGTHCAGIIGARGNNAAGVAGVNWKVKIMPISFLGQWGMGLTSDAILALQYAWKNGARISNNSWGGTGYSQGLYDAILMAGMNRHIFMAAAGNYGWDNDQFGDLWHFYPSDYDLDNIVSVAATDRNDELAEFSCYGAVSVDLAAPGVSILSSTPGDNYESYSGTSMATPFVSGAAALLMAQDANLTVSEIKSILMTSVDKLESLAGKVVTGGRLNLSRALGGGGSPVLKLKFDDGGATAEDFTRSEDWNSKLAGFDDDWFHAAVLNNADFSTDNFVPAFADTDNDGMPDWWEEAMGLDPFSATGVDGAAGDPDGDGLTNYYEFLAGTNPFDADTDHDAIDDFNADSDGDGLSNGQEQQAGTLPGNEWISADTDPTDTDDDGVADPDEIQAGTDPVSAAEPDDARAMQFNGSGWLTVRKEHAHDATLAWTVEAWVKPTGTGTDGIAIRRAEKNNDADPWVDYELGLDGAVPYVSYAFRTETNGTQYVEVRVDAPKALPLNQWTHLAAVRDPATLQTRLYVNGKCAATEAAARLPATTLRGVFETTLGVDFTGQLDAVRVWHYARTGVEIQGNRDVLLPEANLDGEADKNRAPKRVFNFDDGGTTAENSYYLNDWMTGWQNAAEIEGDAQFASSPWPPLDLDSDDDASTDVDERSNNTMVLRSESPYVPRALKFGGLGSVLADEQVNGAETMLFAVSNWTVEAWVKPTAMADHAVSLVKRATKNGGSATFELGLDTNLAVYAGFDRLDAGHEAFHVTSGGTNTVLKTNEWAHLAASYSADDHRLILYVNGIEQVRGTDVSALPVVERAGQIYLGSVDFVGELKEVRVWNKTRTAAEVYANFSRTLLFSVASLENSFQCTGIEGNQSYLGRATELKEDGYWYDHSAIEIYPDLYNPLPYMSGRWTHKFTLETWIRMQPGAAGGMAVERQVDLMLVDQGADWRTTEGIEIGTNGTPVVRWDGQVNVVSPVYEDESVEVINEDGKTNKVNRKVLKRLDIVTEVKPRALVSEVDLRDGKWHHVAAVGDSERIRLYIDGELDTESLSYYVFKAREAPAFEAFYWQYHNAGSALRIGSETLQADLDEVMFWNEDRTEEEIRNHMDYGMTAKEIQTARLPIDPVPEFAMTNDTTVATPPIDLVSYMIFDGTPPLPYVVDAANEPMNYRILPDVNGNELLRDSRPPVFVDRLRTLKDDLAGYFAADDGGETAENFMQRNDLDYAGLLGDGVEFVSAPADIMQVDTDGDGLPDAWEEANGLDAGDPDGANGAYGDADGDGLSNVAELLAGTDPNNWDTDGNGVSDYDTVDTNCTANCLTYGEYYMDGDQIPDAWEILYADVLSPLVNDADADPDGDGWKNLAEYLGEGFDYVYATNTTSTELTNGETDVTAQFEVVGTTQVAPTRPNDAASYPVPAIHFTFLGDALQYLDATTAEVSEKGLLVPDSIGLVVWAYSDALMRKPDAQAFIPVSGEFENGVEATVEGWDIGHVRQGDNIFMAFIDENGDGIWNEGEWMGFSEGYAQTGKENISWGSAKVRIGLTDKPAGYVRFDWEQDLDLIASALAQVNGTTYKVMINSVGEGRNIYTTTRDLESMERPYITEMDLRQAGVGPMNGSYKWYIQTGFSDVFASGTNFISYPDSLAAPTILEPASTTWVHAQNTLRMKLSSDAAQVAVRIMRGGSTIQNSTFNAPFVGNTGEAEMDLPWLAGWGTFTNGDYTIQVSAVNPRFTSASAATSFSVNLQEAPVGAGTIKGSVKYFGNTSGSRVVAAYEGAGFDQRPAAQAKAAGDGTYVLKGLRAGTYHVRGFVDSNGNGGLDAGEAWGFAKGESADVILQSRKAPVGKTGSADTESPYAVEYVVKSIDVDAQGAAEHQDLISYDALAYRKNNVDSDGDGLTDDEELLLGTSPVRIDSDFDGLFDGAEDADHDGVVDATETDPTNDDTDGDGMPDGWEVQYGLDPLDPDDAAGDADGDTLSNLDEYNNGSKPNSADSDGDGLPDDWEVEHALDPASNDAAEDADNDGLTNGEEEALGTDPNRSDSDGDGLPDLWERDNPNGADGAADNDGDGLTNAEEFANGTAYDDSDTDDDGLPDGWEVDNHLDPLSAEGADGADGDPDGDGLPNSGELAAGTNPNGSDYDLDGLPDGDEWTLGTDPLDWDSDGDGFSDGVEVVLGTNPKSAAAMPASAGNASSAVVRASAAGYNLAVQYTVNAVTATPVILEFQENDVLTNGTNWVPTGVQRVITAGGTYSNAIPDGDGDGILNIRIRSK
ncbi:MAG: LamG-like jellyroll fold domain-containing protein [Kiritimatiellia bacterium]